MPPLPRGCRDRPANGPAAFKGESCRNTLVARDDDGLGGSRMQAVGADDARGGVSPAACGTGPARGKISGPSRHCVGDGSTGEDGSVKEDLPKEAEVCKQPLEPRRREESGSRDPGEGCNTAEASRLLPLSMEMTGRTGPAAAAWSPTADSVLWPCPPSERPSRTLVLLEHVAAAATGSPGSWWATPPLVRAYRPDLHDL